MYEQYFGFSARPFQLNPDPRFFFRSAGHKRAMAYMRYGLQQEQGFIVVTGDVGTGKTMLVNNLFKELETESVVAAKIVSTNLRDIDLLRMLAAQFGIRYEREAKSVLLKKLEEFFTQCAEEGKRVLLVVDEAQNLPRGALEELRMLSNFDHKGQPLVQSFLLGQREFRSVIRAPGLEQLRQRIIAAYHLKPLSAPEVKSYVEHRLTTVGWSDDPEIDEDVYHDIFVATSGVPRRINTLCDRLLLACYLDEKHRITLEMLDSIRAELEAEQGDPLDDEDAVFDVSPDPVEAPRGADGAPSSSAQAIPNSLLASIETRLDRIEKTLSLILVRTQDPPSAPSPAPVPPAVFAEPAETEPVAYTPPEPEHAPYVPTAEMTSGESGFPVWTTTLISVVLVGAAVLAVIGYKIWQP